MSIRDQYGQLWGRQRTHWTVSGTRQDVMGKDCLMLSEKEIADYVHGQPGCPEKQQFGFSDLNKIQHTPTKRWPTLADSVDGDSGLAGRITRATKAHKAHHALSWLRKTGGRKMSVTKRSIFLIMLFLVVFAATFILESQRAPANPGHGFSRSTLTVQPEAVNRL